MHLIRDNGDMSKLDERINKRLNKKLNRKKRVLFFKITSFILMISISVVCIFFVDYNMNKMLNKKSLIEKNIEFIKLNSRNYLSDLKNIEF